MKEKLKNLFADIRQRVTSTFLKSSTKRPSREQEELFVERREQRPFVLAVFFTTCKLMLLFVVLLGCAAMGLVLGVAKAKRRL